MDYLTQYYKNNVIKLQHELYHLTEVYNFKLNEAKEPEPGILQWLTGRKAREAAETAAQTGARRIVPAVQTTTAVVETAAQRAARMARERLATRVAAREARQGVIRTLRDIHPDNWEHWFLNTSTTQAEKDAYRLLFPFGAMSGNLPGHGIVTLQKVRDGGGIRILWWDDTNETWRWVKPNTNTGAGNVGPLGYLLSPKSGPQVSSIENIDNLQYAHSLSDKKNSGQNTGQNTGDNTGLNTGLGGVAALYMSYDAKFVSKKIKFLYESDKKLSSPEEAELALKATLESDPGFHDDIVNALSYHLGTFHPHITAGDNTYRPDRDRSILDIRQSLHGSAPEGGYRTFDQAHDTLQDIVFDQAHHGRNAMYNTINDGIGIALHDDRSENAGRVLRDINKKSINMVQSFQTQRGTKRDNAEYFAKKSPSNI
jgi:hypothetical protein